MKMTYTTADGRLSFEIEVSTGKQAFQQVAGIQELFEQAHVCGACKGKRIHCEVREHGGNQFYNLRCCDCRAQFDFGQKKDGKGMFPKTHDKDTKQALPNGGWYVWSGQRRDGD